MALKGLNALIKLHKRSLDEMRRSITTLQNQRTELIALIERLEKELREEHEKALGMAEMAAFFGNFSKHIRDRQEKIIQEIKEIDRKIENLRKELAEKFSELKKFEIAREQFLAREKEEAQRKETIALDEIALQQFVRKETEES